MDMIPGPRHPRFYHPEVPYLCGPGDFPRPEDYRKGTEPRVMMHSGYVQLNASKPNPIHMYLSTKHKPFSRTSCNLFDVIEQDAAKPKFRIIPDEWERDGTKMKEAIQTVVENKEGRIGPDDVAYYRDQSFVEPVPHDQRDPDSLVLGSAIPGPHHFDPLTRLGFYDGLDFNTYPERWHRYLSDWLDTQENLISAPDDPRFGLMMASQIQAWLYFGLLSEFLGKLVVAEDFLTYRNSGKPIITLQKLMTSREFEIVSDRVKSMTREEQLRWVHKMDEILNVVRSSCKAQHESGSGLNTPFEEELFLSIRILGSMIDTFIEDRMSTLRSKSQAVDDSHSWGIGKIIENRMNVSDEVGYCKSDIKRLMNCLPVNAMYYMSLLMVHESLDTGRPGQPSQPKTHQKGCTEDKCVADNISLADYETQHSILCNDCEFLGPDMAAIEDAIKNNFIPILRLNREDSGEISVQVGKVAPYRYVDRPDFEHWKPYVAISHVWSQGMGNPKENKLPLCQLTHIHSMIRNCWNPLTIFSNAEDEGFMKEAPLSEFVKSEAWFWIDTLCVPTAKPWRRKAIQNMRYVYQNAMAVLVKDNLLAGLGPGEGLSCKLRSCEEIAGWILASPWWRRLWTFQEAILARNLLVYCNDGVLDVPQFLRFMVSRIEGYMVPTSSFAEEAHLSDERKAKSTEQPPESIQEKVGESSSPDKPNRIAKQHEPATRTSFQALHDVDDSLVKGLCDLVNLSARFAHQDHDPGLLRDLWNSAYLRMTSYEKDKALCLAALLNLDLAKLQAIEDEEQRVEVFYSMLPHFPQDILFSNQKKLSKPGLRWADCNLLTPKLHDYAYLTIPDSGPPIGFTLRTKKGLIVNCPGILVFMDVKELPTKFMPFFLYSERMSCWLQFSTDRTFEGPATPRLENRFAILIEDHRLVIPPQFVAEFDGDKKLIQSPELDLRQERKAVLVVFSELWDPAQETPYVVRAERYGCIRAIDSDSSSRGDSETTYVDPAKLREPPIHDWNGETRSWEVG